jgi:zinc-finger of transposase IS204/IS1001/IS1096/IS1165
MAEAEELIRSCLPEWRRVKVDALELTADRVLVRVLITRVPRCTACKNSAVSYHSYYDRTLKDLPWQGRRVEVRLRVRRFRCRNAGCSRNIFAEQLPALAAPRARETRRLGYTLGGLPGARLLIRLGIVSNPESFCAMAAAASGD